MQLRTMALLLSVLALSLFVSSKQALAAVTINEYQGPGTVGANELTTGPDGDLWITADFTNDIWKMSPTGTVLNRYAIPTASATPWGITTGSDGNLWFTEYNAGKIARITTTGVITEFPLPVTTNTPEGITAGPDCNLWFTERFHAQIGRISPSGTITEFPLSSISSQATHIAVGADGNLWFTEYGAQKIGRITPQGAITEFAVDTSAGLGGGGPDGIAAGWDGNLWFTMSVAHAIGKITPSGTISYYTLLTPSATVDTDIATGPDGFMFFTDPSGNAIGVIDPSGSIAELAIPTPSSGPSGITTGPDQNVWFAEYATDKIGQVIVPTPDLPGQPRKVSTFAGDGSVQVQWSPPTSDGGAAITGYTVTPYIGTTAQTPVTVSTSPAVVSGLINGTAYTFKVTANNSVGSGWPATPCGTTTPSSSQSAVSTQQYHLANSDGSTWADIDASRLQVNLAPSSSGSAFLGGNADLFTANAGYNQDLGMFVSVNGGADQLLAWKESGGFAGTFSPNAAFVHGVYPVTTGNTYVFKLKWKTNKNAAGATIFAGAGPISGRYSPTRLSVEMVPTANSSDASSTQQYSNANSDGSTWADIDATNLQVSLSPSAAATAVLGANADLFTARAGFNQDIGIFVSVDSAPDQLVAWKESGGFAGTFSPNAAFVRGTFAVSSGNTYVFKLKWKTNKNASGATIFAGAGPINSQYSPTRLSVQLVSVANSFAAVSTMQYINPNSDGSTWAGIDATNLQVTVSPGGAAFVVLGGNADLFTANAGYNQDLAIFVNVNGGGDQLVAWKESGGFAGTFSPNAAFVQGIYPVTSGNTYVFKLEWKTNRSANAVTIFAGAGPISGQYSPTSLTAQLVS